MKRTTRSLIADRSSTQKTSLFTRVKDSSAAYSVHTIKCEVVNHLNDLILKRLNRANLLWKFFEPDEMV